ncbi:MAG TPA: FHA domain-containing protein [Gammaproteobacteria bacterium]
MQIASQKILDLLETRIHCVFLSGEAGVGKTTLIRQHLSGVDPATVSWLKPGLETREDLLHQLLHDIGPGDVDASAPELRNILEVFLRHQTGNGRYSYIVADNLERVSAFALRELETLAQMRLRNRPIVYLLLATRNDDLVANMLPQYDGGPLARAVHQRLIGFTLDETRSYIRACLRGAGCEWSDELMSDEVIVDVQAFTHGVVGDVNALCARALDLLAQRSAGSLSAPKVTRALLKDAGTELRLRYDATAWSVSEETLSPDAVHLSDTSELRIEAARLVVSSGRNRIAEITLNRPRMVLGRDKSCDISLDSMYVSRYQNLFMETADGWLLIDLGSTNGCFVNGRRVREHHLRDGDLIAVGHHQLRFLCPQKTDEELAAARDGEGEATLMTPKAEIGRA